MADFGTQLEDIKQKALGIQSSLKQFDANRQLTAPDPNVSAMNEKLNSALNTSLSSGDGSQTIMDKFNERRKLATEGASAERSLIESQAGTAVDEEKEAGANDLETAREKTRNLGAASLRAVIIQEEEKTNKRVRSLTKQRDEMLAQNKMNEATRLDNLIIGEQEAVSTAKKNFLDTLFGASRELRDQAGFETPAQKGARELKDSKTTAVLNLAAKAPGAGISDSDNYDQALEKYRKSAEYLRDSRKGEAEIDKIEADTIKTRAETAKVKAEQQGLDLTGLDTAEGKALNNAFQQSLLGIDSKFQTEDVKKNFNALIKSGQIEEARSYLKRIAREGSDSVTKQQVLGREEALRSLTAIRNQLINYQAKGGNTNILSGSLENIAKKVGGVADTELRKIASDIQLAIIEYRKAVSGAAFTPSESSQYEALFPSTKNVPALNNALLNSLLDKFSGSQETFYSQMLGPQNYQVLFGKEAPAGSGRTLDQSGGGNIFSGLSFPGSK